MFHSILQKIRRIDPVHAIVLLGILGMGCILLSSVLSTDVPQDAAPLMQTETETPEAYRLRMQEDLTAMLSGMAGVGRVQVLVTVQGSEEFHYAREGDSLVSDAQVRNRSTYVTIGGSGGEALVESVTHPPITGVVVACEGGERSTVKEAVYNAVSVACGISTANIYVTRLA
ncbi:MAG: hypothetical protein E7502_04400 [Ruminococcus sp.]|jgi:stage III sporulation protein AG|nr:hypothetical protein [Ruminococcus sp.]